MFFKAIKLVYEMGRKKAYAEVIAQLETSRNKLTRNRDGVTTDNEIKSIIADLRQRQADEEVL